MSDAPAWTPWLATLVILFNATASGAYASASGNDSKLPGAPGDHYYSLDDFYRVDKIDAHVHIHGRADRFMARATQDHMRILTINVDYPDFPALPNQQRDAISLRTRYPGRVAFAAAFSVDGFHSPGWSDRALKHLDDAFAQGAVGVKIWKNIGMSLKDADGRYVMLDDSRFEPIFSKLEREHIVLLGHQAEPLNCWLPFDNMTVRSDREYFRKHPQYYMYRHPEMPNHEVILAARDHLLQLHPALRFDAVHLASLEWDVDKVADFLERFPTAQVDLAARLVHLEYQATLDRDKVRRFLIRYQDRILYGSDDAYGPTDADPRAAAAVHKDWVADWRFLATADLQRSPDFAHPFTGMHLPREVMDKLYRRNAESLFKGAWSSNN